MQRGKSANHLFSSTHFQQKILNSFLLIRAATLINIVFDINEEQ